MDSNLDNKVKEMLEKSKELRKSFILSRIKLASRMERFELMFEYSGKKEPWPESER